MNNVEERKEERRWRRARSKEAAGFKSPLVRARESKRNFTTGCLPGLEDFVSVKKPEPIRADGLWQKAEDSIGHELRVSQYAVAEQIPWGRSHGRKKVVDFLCWLPWKPEDRIVIEVKWYRRKGSWDKKVPDEVSTLHHCIESKCENVKRAYVVLLGPGIDKMREDGWVSGRLDCGKVRVVDIDFFLAASWCWEL